jgi:O-antigen ligase
MLIKGPLPLASTVPASPAASTLQERRIDFPGRFDELIRRLKPQSLVEWLWWAVFLVWSLLSPSRAPVLLLGTLYIRLTDFLLLVFSFSTLPFLIASRRRYSRAFGWTFLPFTAVCAFAILSAWMGHDARRYDFPYLVFPPVLAWAAMCAGFTVVSSIPENELAGFAERACAAITLVALVYGIVALFPQLGFREEVAADPSFGVLRLAGPLAGPTTLPALFVVGISYLLCGIGKVRESFLAILLSCVLVSAILLSGSRAGLLALLALGILVVVRRVTFRARLALLVSVVIAGVIIFQFALPERLLDFEDNLRLITYQRSLEAWRVNASTIFFGQGYGQLWPWYIHDVHLALGESRWYAYFVDTPFGRMLQHAHSTFLGILAELGLLGFCLLALALAAQIVPVVRSAGKFRTSWLLAPGILASLVVLMFDTLLFKTFTLSAVWWVFFFLTAADHSVFLRQRVRMKNSANASGRLPRLGPRQSAARGIVSRL